MPREPLWIEVPSGTPVARCRGCGAAVYWVTTRRGKLSPVNCAVEGGIVPGAAVVGQLDLLSGGLAQDVQPGRGLSHFADCPDAARFRHD